MGLSPHKVVFGRFPNLPISEDDSYPDFDDPEALAFQLQDKLCYLHDIARENMDLQENTTKARYDKKTRPMYLKAGDQVFLKNFQREHKLSPRYVGPYPVVKATSHNVNLLINDSVKTYHLQHVKPCFRSFLFTLITLFRLFCLAVGSTVATPIIHQYNNTAGMIFQGIGNRFIKAGEWSLVMNFNLTDLKYKVTKLRDIDRETEKLTSLPQEKLFRKDYTVLLQLLRGDCERIESSILELETSTQPRRRKREIFRAGSSFLKFLYGTPDADDADYYNRRLNELSSSQKAADELALKQIKITENSIDIIQRNLGKVSENFIKINKTMSLLGPIFKVIELGFDTAKLEEHTKLLSRYRFSWFTKCFQNACGKGWNGHPLIGIFAVWLLSTDV